MTLEELILERIKIYRSRAKLSQSDMATYMGYSGKSGYGGLENGKTNMTIEQLEKLLIILQIPESEMLKVVHKFYKQQL